MEVADRNEHPFISICDLHDQLLLNVEKVEIFIFGTYLLTAYKSRFTFLGSNYIPLLFGYEYGRTVFKSYRKILERGKIDSTKLYYLSLSWFDTGISIRR